MGFMGSLGLPRMALLKVKPGVFYSNWLENKSAFCCFRVCSGKHLCASSFLIFPGHSSPVLPRPDPTCVSCPSLCPLCLLYAVDTACQAATKPEHIRGVQAELHKAL